MRFPKSSLTDWLVGHIKFKILFSVLAIFIVIYGSTLSYIYSRIKTDLLRSASDIAVSITKINAQNFYRNYELPEDVRKIQVDILSAQKIHSDSLLLEINVVDSTSQILSSTNDENLFAAAVGPRYKAALENTSSVDLFTDTAVPFVRVVEPISAGPSKIHTLGAVEIKYSLKSQFENLARIRTNTLMAGIIILLGISIAITLISQSITRPIETLYTGMGKVNQGDLNIHVPVASRDEIGYLTNTFNDMIDSVRISNERILTMVESSRRFVPDQFLSALGKQDITDVALGDNIHRDMTVFFMDIRSFTDLSETMTADDTLLFLNSLMENVLPAIEQHHGFIDKYIGDAVMALFPNKPDDALLAALDIRQRLVGFNRARQERHQPAIEVGVGINAGDLILGTLGSAGRIDTTVIGSTVNIASRLESLTKEYGLPILLSEATFLAMAPSTRAKVKTQDLGLVKIRGIEQEINLVGILT